MNKIKVIGLCGESGSGKDTVLNWIVSTAPDSTHKIIGHTTRPKREYEINDLDYHFVTIGGFKKMLEDKCFLEAKEFNNWFYGTSITDLKENKINIGVFNPAALLAISQRTDIIEILPIRIIASDKTRIIRGLNRETNPDCEEVIRRFLSDKKDFKNLEKFITPLYLENETTFDTEFLLKIINNFDEYYNQANLDNNIKLKMK